LHSTETSPFKTSRLRGFACARNNIGWFRGRGQVQNETGRFA
jgi:hypothetical protein